MRPTPLQRAIAGFCEPHDDGEDPILLADGFESAFIGIAQQFNTSLACYDYDKCVEVLM